MGYDFNTVEFAVRDGIPIAIDFCNPAPDADIHSVGQANFDWVVEAAATMAIDRAEKAQAGKNNLTWGTFVRGGVTGNPAVPAMTGAKTTVSSKVVKEGKAEKVPAPAKETKAPASAAGKAKKVAAEAGKPKKGSK